MFGSAAKTPFGTGSGFGTGTSAFGQSATTPFGQTSTSLFGGKPTTNLFGQTPAANTGGLFGSTNTSTSTGILGGGAASVFKQTNPTMQGTGFGFGSLGGTTGQAQTSIFGTPQQTPVFGSGTTSGFGTSGSLFGATTATSKPGGLFGSTATTQSTSLFGGGSTGLTTGFSGFGTSATATVGTPLKFSVVAGTDSQMKNGVSHNVSTRHQCITVMKEYEGKSLEELRMEDYQAGRKGGSTTGTLATSTAGGLFGGTATSQTGGLFGSTPGFASGSTSTTLAQTQPGFGGAKGTSFGAGTSLFGQQTQQTGGLFGKTGSLFAPTSTAAGTSAFGTTGFGTTGTTGGLFGQTASAAPSLFGATTTTQASTGLFGATGSIFGQPASSAGSTLFGQSTFGQPAQTGGLFGAKPTGTAFGTPTLGTPSTGGLFGAQKTTGFNFGQTGTTGLGTTGFGTAGSSSLFGSKPVGFGTGTTGTALGTGTTGLFGATSGLGGTSTLGTTGFGTLGGLGTQTASGLGTVSALGGNQNAALLAQQQQELQRQVLALTSSPFGDSPLFRNSLLDKSKVERATTTTTTTQRLGGSPSHYKVMPRPAARIKPRPINSTTMNKSKLFEGLDDDSALSPDTFVPRRSIKKLIIKKKTGSEDSSPVVHVDGSSRLRSLEDSEELGVSTPPYMTSQSPARTLRTTPTRSAREGLDVVDSSESGTPIGVRFSGVTQTAMLDDTIADLNVQSRHDDQAALDDDASQAGDVGRVEPGTKVAMISPSGRRPSKSSGITLTRPDYYSIPSVDELNSQIDEKGEIWVKDFIVAREGYGQAKFFGRTNVAGLDLDAIITFRRREIEVYPDNYTNKPAVGEELNKKAEITLEKVWPNDKSTHQPIRSPERLKLQGWQERIEKATATLGAVFYDYQMDTGKWVFTVEHFTRYGMHEELDDESALKKLKRQPIRTADQFDDVMDGIDEEKLILLKKLREQQEKLLAYEEERQKMSSTLQHDDSERLVLMSKIQEQEEKLRAYEESRQKADVAADRDSDMEDIDNETFPEEMLDEEDEIEQSPASHRLANSLGVNAHRMQVMKASFFGEDDYRPHAMPRDTVASESVARESAILQKPTGLHTRPFQSLDSPGPTLSPRVPRMVQKTTVAGRTADSLFGSPKIGAHPVRPAASRFAVPPSPMLLPSAIGSPFDTGIKIVGARRQRAPVPKHNSLTANKEHLIADMGLTMGRSFRVGWGPGLTLAHSGRTLSKEPRKAPRDAGSADGMEFLVPKPSRPVEGQGDVLPFRVSLERVDIAPHLTDADRAVLDQHESALEVELNCSQWTVKDGCPMFKPCPGTRALHHHAQTARKNMEALVSGPMLEEAEQISLVWDLVVALWGQLGDTESDDDDHDGGDDDDEESEKMDRDGEINTEQRDSYESQMARREALSKWLEFAAKKRIKQEVDQTDFQERNYLKMILSYLSGRQVSAACHAAQQKGDYRLALLLSQVAGSSEFRHMVQRQLGDWEQTKADKLIKDQRVKIYALLAGVMVWRMSREEVNVCEGFDWKRCFAIHLWYFCSAKSSIQDALKAYEDAFKGRTTHGEYSCAPLPPHMESSSQAPGEEGEEEEPAAVKPRDTCYHLLKLYCKRSHRLERALAPSTSTTRQLDYRLSWHLNQALQSLGYTHLSEYHTGVLHGSFASQLENLGIWEWSVFILLHIRDRVRRECAVRDILCRHCRLSQDEEYLRKERFVRDKLRVPVQWIHEAKALRARAEKCPNEEAFHLLKASHWNLGHNVILKNLASEAIVNEEYDTLKRLLGELQPRERNSTVKRWATGGQVFLDYLVLLEKVQAIAKGAQESSRIPSKYELEQIHMEVSSLCSRINHVPCATAMDRLCQSDMAKMCTNFLKLVSKELMEHEPEEEANLSTHVLAPHVNKLPMPEDCLLVELQELTAAYVTEVTAV